MPELAFVMSPNQSWFLREFVETLQHELMDQGVPSSVHTDGFPEPTPQRVYALVAPHEFMALEGEDALPDEAILRRAIFICAEQPGSAHLDEDIELSRRAGTVFTINSRSVAEFWRAGIPARHLRPGYSALRDRYDAEAQRDIDVLLIGAFSRRRTRYLAACARLLASYNCCLLFSDDSEPHAAASSTFVTDDKWDLLTRAKIVLNIHQSDAPYFEWLRALDAIHTGAVVVTEHSGGLAPLVAGQHLFVATPTSLPFVLDATLRDPEGLARVRAAAYERIRSWMPMALSVSVLRAAVVELVGRPVSGDAPLGRRLTPRSRLPYRWLPTPSDEPDAGSAAIRRGLEDETDAELAAIGSALKAELSAESAAIRRGLKDVSLELIEMRREIARLEQLMRSGNGDVSGPELVHESPAWDLRGRPRVTVVTALYNHSTLVHESLDSVSTSRLREFEVIVVDDGSSDSSRAMATEWMTAHPWIPARLIAHGVNRGLGAARNTATDAARAPYCFVLDAGNAVYPRCLDTLVWTLDSLPEFAFVYPMLEVFGLPEALLERDAGFLYSAFGWQPERLRLGNYIEAPAMIRVDRLRELGGYSTDRRLYGWEDYDLWCRMAERGWTGQLVPQMLARFRASMASIASTDLSKTIAMAAIIERAPKLMEGILPPP